MHLRFYLARIYYGDDEENDDENEVHTTAYAEQTRTRSRLRR